MFNYTSRKTLIGILAASSASIASLSVAQPAGVSQALTKPKLHSITMDKLSFTSSENIAFKVKFQASPCVFNIEFRHPNGNVKSVGYFSPSAGQLEQSFSASMSYWGINPGSYIVAAVPHPNPSVAGPKGVACTGDSVLANLNIVVPAKDSAVSKVVGSGKAATGNAKADAPEPDKNAPAKPGAAPAKF